MNIELVPNTKCKLGEGPLWDVAEQALYWVDYRGPTLFRFDYSSGEVKDWKLAGRTCGGLAVRDEGRVIIAREQGLYCFDLKTADLTAIAEPHAGNEDIWFNDGKTDPRGRFLAGSMDVEGTNPIGALFALDSDLTCRKIDDQYLCFNGPCFSPDGKTFYSTGHNFETLEAYDYDLDAGTLSNGRTIFSDGIVCDGATVDADGCIWNAQWGTDYILRLTPEGKVNRKVELPKQLVTSIMFGGPDLDILFVTTAGEAEWGAYPTEPDAGSVFAIDGLGAAGLPEARFGGIR